MGATLRSKEEFIDQLARLMVPADAYMREVTDAFELGIAEFGSEEIFLKQPNPRNGFLVQARHIADYFFNMAKKFNEGDVLYPRTSQSLEHLYYAREVLGEIKASYQRLFKRFKEFVEEDGVLKPNCHRVIEAIDACIAFTKQQCDLAGIPPLPQRAR